MKKSLSMLLATVATIVMAVSVVAENEPIVVETFPSTDMNSSYSKEYTEEPSCGINCEAGFPLNGDEDY